MKRVRFFSIYPQVVEGYLAFGTMVRAQKQGALECEVRDLRAYAHDRHGSVDGRPYGGGAGMVMRPDVLARAVAADGAGAHPSPRDIRILTAPSGEYFAQHHAQELYAQWDQGCVLSFVCGRFSGVDERFIEGYVDHVFSLGDFVCSGGELPCLMIAETVIRLIPGVLSNPQSVLCDSFGQECVEGVQGPVYTRPPVFAGREVPAVLLSGDHEAIVQWRQQAALRRMQKRQGRGEGPEWAKG